MASAGESGEAASSSRRERMMMARQVWLAANSEPVLEAADEWAHAAGYAVRGALWLGEPPAVPHVGRWRARPPGRPDRDDWLIFAAELDRLEHLAQLQDSGWQFARLIHPDARIAKSAYVRDVSVIGPAASIGREVALWRSVYVGAGVRVGDRTIIEDGAFVGSGARVGAEAHVCAGARLGADAVVPDEAFVPPHAVVAPAETFSD